MEVQRGRGRRTRRSPKVVIEGILASQGGGHGQIRGVKGETPLIAKPLIAREADFYRKIKGMPMERIVPEYIGRSSLEGKDEYILLRDLTDGMTSACIADLKLGTRSYEVDAPREKAIRQMKHTLGTTTKSHAVRCIDVCLRQNGTVVRKWGKKEGRNMGVEELKNVLRMFLPGSRMTQFNEKVKGVRSVLQKAKEILPNMRLYSASLLIVYDGDKKDSAMFLKIIDFAHAYTDLEAENGDIHCEDFNDNTDLGLSNLAAFTESE